jgi:phosphatidylglycerol:prolipoprotein diacylglycerol transferase
LYRVLFDFGYVAIHPFNHVVLPLVSLIFLSIGFSFAASRKLKWPLQIIIAIIFAAVGDVIAYFLFDIIYNNVSYQGQPLSERFPAGTEYPIVIYSYGFMLMVAFVVGTIFLILEGKRDGISSDVILDMMTFVIVGSIIGARIVYILLMPEEFKPVEVAPGEFLPAAPWWDITRGGLSIHGGIFGALLLGIIFVKIKRLSFWKMADFTIVAVPLGIFFGRIGCFLNGCCYGVPFENQAAKPWWTKYPTEAIPANVTPPYPLDGLCRHPAPLYMAIAALCLFVWLRFFRRNKSLFTGHTFLMFLFWYSAIRFVQEMYRFEASSKVIGTWLTYAQLASIIIALLALFIMLEINRRISIAERFAAETVEEAEAAPPEKRAPKPAEPAKAEMEQVVEDESADIPGEMPEESEEQEEQ